MGARVLLNLLNKLGKRDKMRGLPSILSLFCNKFNINSIIQELIISYDIITLKSHFCRKNFIIMPLCMQLTSILWHGVISLPDVTLYDKQIIILHS